MITGLILAFGIVLILFAPFNTQLRFYISDYKFSFSFSLKIANLPPEYVFAVQNGDIIDIHGETTESIQKISMDTELGLNLQDLKDIVRFIPLNYVHTLVYFGDKENAMRTALVLKSTDITLSLLESALPFPKEKASHTIIPEYNANKLFIQSEIRFSVTLFVIFLTLYKILKNTEVKYEHK